jgi:hypothetical protein
MAKYQIIIGRAERVDFTGISLNVPAKIDSGAFRSSVHASDIKEVKNKEGVKVLRFNLFGHPCAPVKRPIEVDTYDKLSVKSSNGSVEERYEVTLKIKIGSKIFNTSFTLADRASNVFPVLIGRKALTGRYMIDTSRTSVKRQDLIKEFGLTGPVSEEDFED